MELGHTNRSLIGYVYCIQLLALRYLIPRPPCRLLRDPTPGSRMSRAMERVRREVSSTAVVLYKGALSEQILLERGNL